MREVDLPRTESVPELVRSFAACVASVTETPLSDVPQPRADLRGAIAHWRGWLAGRGAGLVPIANPARFNWPGYWLAVLGDAGAGRIHRGRHRGADVRHALWSRAQSARPCSAWVRQRLTCRSARATFCPDWTRRSPTRRSPPPRLHGRVEAIAVAQRAAGPMRQVEKARALAGRGLAGDRYAAKAGTFTPANDTARGYDLTLIEAEVLDRLALPDGGKLGYAEARRNVVTRGVDLNALVGQPLSHRRRRVPGAAFVRAVLPPGTPHRQGRAPWAYPSRRPARRHPHRRPTSASAPSSRRSTSRRSSSTGAANSSETTVRSRKSRLAWYWARSAAAKSSAGIRVDSLVRIDAGDPGDTPTRSPSSSRCRHRLLAASMTRCRPRDR